MRVQEVTAYPPVAGMCDLLDLIGAWFAGPCNAGSGCLLDRVGWGFVELDPLVSSSLGSNSLELADCMADPRKPYGEMADLWGSAVTYGEMRRRVAVWGNRDTVWGGGPCVGRPRNRMENESRMKNRNMEAGGGRLGMGAAGPHGEPVPMADLA